MRCYVPPPVTTRPGVPRHTTSPASASERLRAGSTVGSQPLARDQPVAAGDPGPAELTAPLGLRLALSSSCPAKAAPAPRGAGTGGPKRRPSRPQPPTPIVLVDLHGGGTGHVCRRSQEEEPFQDFEPVRWPKCKFIFKRRNLTLPENCNNKKQRRLKRVYNAATYLSFP